MLITLMSSVVVINQGLFPVSRIQLISRYAEAGRDHSQIGKLANGNIPYHKRHAQFMNGDWLGEKAI